MTLDPEICWRAWTTRDARFVGRFVMAVTSTRIYCRPGCPARLPARRNVRFYATPAAAETAGFRACLRCRPDRAPGAPAANGTATTVTRALRLIDEGALADGTLETLAARLGVTSRWLRELFERHVGAAPLDVARRPGAPADLGVERHERLDTTNMARGADEFGSGGAAPPRVRSGEWRWGCR